MTQEVVLSVGDWRLGLRPDLGGAIASLKLQGVDVLRPTPRDAQQVLDTACFPLVPWCNRIADARFEWNGQEMAVMPTPGFAPHALHGQAWRLPWSVAETDPTSVTLALTRTADADWPWTWSARQRFELGADGLETTLSLTNEASSHMPAGLGLHPYFIRTPSSRLRLASREVWMVDGNMVPTTREAAYLVADWTDGDAIGSDRFVDNCYGGWDGVAVISGGNGEIGLSASENARWAHVFTPVGDDYFCVEPVTHRPNGLNAPKDEDAGVVALKPGGTLSMTMRIGHRLRR